jgi:hypothetical protein
MSQDKPTQAPSPEPEENQPRTKVSRRNNRRKPFWKTQVINVLRGTIGILETTVVKLETESLNAVDTQRSAKVGWWRGFLLKIRAFLPGFLSNNLSDTGLTAIVAGISIILIWTSTGIFTSKPTEVATVPPVQETAPPTEEIPTPTVTSTPDIPEPTPEITPEPTPEITPDIPEPTPEITPDIPEPTPEITPDIPEVTPEPTPEPTPAVELTPEEILIASIKNRVAEISVHQKWLPLEHRSTEGLIKSIQANFLDSTLTIKISNDWYTLKESQRNKLATQIFQCSQELDFTHLEITDSQGILLARSPVVGTEMIIFQGRA